MRKDNEIPDINDVPVEVKESWDRFIKRKFEELDDIYINRNLHGKKDLKYFESLPRKHGDESEDPR